MVFLFLPSAKSAMHQGSSLKGLPRLLLCQLGGCQFAELIVDQWQQLFSNGRIA